MNQLIDRIPPQNIDAEKALLGSIMLENEVILYAQNTVKPEDFYKQSHALLFKAMLDLLSKDKPLDSVCIIDHLLPKGELEKIGGSEYLASLIDHVPTSANHEHYANIIADKSRLRKTLYACHKGIDKIHQNGTESSDIISGIGKDLADIQADELTKTSYDIKDLMIMYNDQVLAASEGKSQGLETRFSALNGMTRGFQQGDLIIIAARPSHGKSSLALNMADDIATGGHTVAVFSLEMRAEQISKNLMAARAKVNVSKIRPGVQFTNEEHIRIFDAQERFSNAQFFLDDAASMTVQTLRAKTRRIAINHDLKAVFVDYLQLMSAGKKCNNREQEISHISHSLKALAKELKIPVIALAQLNRDSAKRPDKRPRLTDLRESGAIEQDADLIMLLYREYMDTLKPEDDGKADLIVAKQRQGPTGRLPLTFTPYHTRFDPDRVRELEWGL